MPYQVQVASFLLLFAVTPTDLSPHLESTQRSRSLLQHSSNSDTGTPGWEGHEYLSLDDLQKLPHHYSRKEHPHIHAEV